MVKFERGHDQSHVAKGLWKIPHELQGIRVNLLRVQSHMVCVAQEILENTQRFSCPPHPCETGDEPEATHQECSLPGLRPAVRLVPVEQRVPRELLHHRVHRAHDSSVSRPCESYERHQEAGRVQRVCCIVHPKCITPTRPSL